MKKIFLLLVAFIFGFGILHSQDSSELKPKEPFDTDGDGYRNVTKLAHILWVLEKKQTLGQHMELDCDINASAIKYLNGGKGWIPSGQDDLNATYPYVGTIRGKGHVIDSLYQS